MQFGNDVLVPAVETTGPASSQLIVRRLVVGGSSWQQVGSKLNYFDNTQPSSPALAIVAGVPHIAWQEQNSITGVTQVYVKRLLQTPSPDTWESVGNSLNPDPARNAVSPDIAEFAGAAHVSFANATSGPRRAVVLKETGAGWAQVGADLVVDVTRDIVSPKLATTATDLVLAWSERLIDDDRIHVARFDSGSTTWQLQGASVNDGEGSAGGKCVEFVDGALVIAYAVDASGVDRVYAKRFNVGTLAWVPLGDALNVTVGSASTPSLADIGGRAYMSHREVVAGVPRIVLSRLADGGDQWDVFPAFVGPNASQSATLATVGQTPWVGLVESAGSGAVWRLLPSVTSLDADATPNSATIRAQSDLFDLPFEIDVDLRVVGDGSQITGASRGTAVDRTVEFSGLGPATQYEARIWGTDLLGRKYKLESLTIFTDLAEPPADEKEPTVKATWRKRQSGRPAIRGTAQDATSLARVEVAIAFDRRATKCAWVSGGTLTPGDCVEPDWQPALGTAAFRFPLATRLAKRMMKRPYEVYVRAIDAAGNVSEVDAYRCGKQVKAKKSRKRVARCNEWQ